MGTKHEIISGTKFKQRNVKHNVLNIHDLNCETVWKIEWIANKALFWMSQEKSIHCRIN